MSSEPDICEASSVPSCRGAIQGAVREKSTATSIHMCSIVRIAAVQGATRGVKVNGRFDGLEVPHPVGEAFGGHFIEVFDQRLRLDGVEEGGQLGKRLGV